MKFKGKNDLKEISEFKCIAKRDCAYPNILDKDPKFAAEFLTIKDSEETLKLMKNTLSSFKGNGEILNPLQYTILFSQFNYNWFCEFTNRLEEIITGEKFIPEEINGLPLKNGVLQVYPPFHYSSSGKKPLLDTFKVKTTDPVDLYRIKYLKKSVELEDFREGFPAWYLMKNSTVYEVYNEITNVRVRIDFRNGEFMYFVSGASDNWKQISGVPLEMDHIVSALLFRN